MRFALIPLIALGCDSPLAGPVARPSEAPPPPPCPPTPTRLGAGLMAEQHPLTAKPIAGSPPCIDVVRADLAHYRLRVLTAKDGSSHPAPTWRDTFHLVAVINAGMFHSSGKPVGLVIEEGVAHSADNKRYGGYFAFGPRAASDPPVTIAGRDCPGFDLGELRKRYRSIVQGSRLLGCSGEALPWQDKKQYSAAAVGIDRQGRVVLMHARAAVTMTELARSLAGIDLAGAIFLEGGPEASLVVRGSAGELARVGSYETGFVENDGNRAFWWLPNVIGLEAQDASVGGRVAP